MILKKVLTYTFIILSYLMQRTQSSQSTAEKFLYCFPSASLASSALKKFHKIRVIVSGFNSTFHSIYSKFELFEGGAKKPAFKKVIT
jgi:hypothetical protein